MRHVLAVLLGLAMAACGGGGGGGGGVTGPSGPTYPQVAGNYAGTLDIFYPELGTTDSCTASTVVTQSGASVSATSIVVSGSGCGERSVPLGITTIDTAGAFTATGSYNEPSCGVFNYASSGGFQGREVRFTLTAVSTTCWNMDITGVLSR